MNSVRFSLLVVLCVFAPLRAAFCHVPHDIIYSLGVSPNYAEDGLVFSSSTQFGESHLVSHNRGESFSESNTGMLRSLVTGHTFSLGFKTNGVIYLATEHGYYKSTDRGANWVKQKQLQNEPILAIAIAPNFEKNKSLYLLTKTGVHVVRDGGVHVKTLQEHDEIQFGKLRFVGSTLLVHRVSHAKPKKKKGMEHIDYMAGSIDVFDFKTKTWAPLSGRFEKSIITDFDVHRSRDGVAMVVAAKDGSAHLSHDAGKTWKPILERDEDFVRLVAFSPNYAEDRTIAAAFSKGFVFLSQDDGKEWLLKSNGLSRWGHHVNIHVNHLQFSPDYANDGTIFLGKTTGFYKTTDCGKFWRHVNVWNPKWGYFVYPAPNKDSRDVFTATYNSGISRSHDGGDTWQSANIGITSAFANSMELSPNYEEDQTIFVVDIVTGLYRSSDGGRSWAAEKGVDLSNHYEQQVLYRQFGVSPNYKENGLMFFFTVPRKVLGLDEKHVWKYNDKTGELKRVLVGDESNYINDFAFSPRGAKREKVFAASARGLFLSEDQGDTWNLISKGNFDKILISPNFETDGLVYIMTSTGGVKVSRNGGNSFKAVDFDLNGQPVENLTFSPTFTDDNTLYAATFGEGVFRSTDSGETWSYFALRGKLLYTGLAFSANFAIDQTMFAPAIDGIYRSTDGGDNWENILNQTQFLPKEPFLTLKDPEGHAIPISLNVQQIKEYGGYDSEASPLIHRTLRNMIQKNSSPKAYLGSYYHFAVEADYAIEIYFYGSAIDYKTVLGPNLGLVDIYLDGKKQTRVDLYSPQKKFDATGFKKSGLPVDFHTLRIQAVGEKNEKSSGTAITFNAANIGD